ncbi:hypothetical protein SAMN05446589_9626 [Streptomyces sp. OV198]|jgi:hypothetical protein|uniref:hypothetical protein n=1 Tax=Streptomyces sp. OV198 TaxID=1882787 RepID=UPI000BC668DC|nr:hypothetical protein [Streptomyces sp. OV198]SOF02474.1 hypothetical protein SAMN05446589_9626 [Streptomyces sp. OV198]
MKWYFVMEGGFTPLSVAPGCVIAPAAPRSFGFGRVLLALLAVLVLVWGSLSGHLVECVAAVVAAALVEVVSRTVRQWKAA